MVHLGEYLGKLLALFLKTALPLIRNVLKPSAKSVSVPLGLTAAATATDAAIQKKKKKINTGMTTLIFSNNDLNNFKKTIKSLEDSGLLIKDVTETIKMREKNY